MNEQFFYVYEGELLERLQYQAKMSTEAGEIQVIPVLIDGKEKVAHIGYQKKRREIKMIDSEIKGREGELQHLEKVPNLAQRERNRFDWLTETLKHLKNEKWYAENMKFIGKGVVRISDGTTKDQLQP